MSYDQQEASYDRIRWGFYSIYYLNLVVAYLEFYK